MREFHRILIGDLLDMGLIASGTPSVAPEPSEVVVLLERARSTFVKGLGLAIPVNRAYSASGPVLGIGSGRGVAEA